MALRDNLEIPLKLWWLASSLISVRLKHEEDSNSWRMPNQRGNHCANPEELLIAG
jgi:hypothetical protein